jgi:hypothetical protein
MLQRSKANVQEAAGTLPERFNSNIRLSVDEPGVENPFFSAAQASGTTRHSSCCWTGMECINAIANTRQEQQAFRLFNRILTAQVGSCRTPKDRLGSMR